jgi:hypothetical protein
MKKNRTPLAWVTLILIVAMLSCDIPTAIIPPATSIPGIVDTKAAMTWQAFQTNSAGSATSTNAPSQIEQPITSSPSSIQSSSPPTETQIPILTLPPTSSPTPIPSFTPIASLTPFTISTATSAGSIPPTQRPASCNQAQFVKDVTIPDGTQIPPDTDFTKVWRIKNSGTCTWDQTYRFVFVSGDRMNGSDVPLPQSVAPGSNVDIAVNLVSPSSRGFKRGNWMIQGRGETFGSGSNQNQPFWVQIDVENDSAFIIYDFGRAFCQAKWESSAGVLPCPGTIGDRDGFVYLWENPDLENRHENEPALWTNPEMVKNGWISGTYPKIRIKDTYRFAADIGCLAGYNKCSVTFELYYQDGNDKLAMLGKWNEVYDGSITRVDVDLSFLAGQSIRFVLAVRVNGGSPSEAAAFWLVPQIRLP